MPKEGHEKISGALFQLGEAVNSLGEATRMEAQALALRLEAEDRIETQISVLDEFNIDVSVFRDAPWNPLPEDVGPETKRRIKVALKIHHIDSSAGMWKQLCEIFSPQEMTELVDKFHPKPDHQPAD